jgi:hypothetical protein
MNTNDIEPGDHESRDYAGEEFDREMFPTPEERKKLEEEDKE